ncbi:uncharacterized protein [Ptychodera flava]|uniref:uncharacterized protein n=1 Tax=Ptychodera flava TaxID=63121 RepID=UPI00396A3473
MATSMGKVVNNLSSTLCFRKRTALDVRRSSSHLFLGRLGGKESKRARLVDGETPYGGRVEIYHSNEWLPVLYYSPGAHSLDWSLVSADVVCKESGYPGAMWHDKDDFALRNDERRRVYNVVLCRAVKSL